jgi:hypothetical protein
MANGDKPSEEREFAELAVLAPQAEMVRHPPAIILVTNLAYIN